MKLSFYTRILKLILTKSDLVKTNELTLKWSRGFPMDPKISFRALERKH